MAAGDGPEAVGGGGRGAVLEGAGDDAGGGAPTKHILVSV